jgi:hypothetical protein
MARPLYWQSQVSPNNATLPPSYAFSKFTTRDYFYENQGKGSLRNWYYKGFKFARIEIISNYGYFRQSSLYAPIFALLLSIILCVGIEPLRFQSSLIAVL